MPTFSFVQFFSPILKLFQKQQDAPNFEGTSKKHSSNYNNDNSSRSGSNSIECYACTQVGVPIFHSTRYDWDGEPQWEASAGSSLYPASNMQLKTKKGSKKRPLQWPTSLFGAIIDPRSESVRRCNRAILLARAVALAIDPVFFYALSIRRHGSCIYMDRVIAIVVTFIRTCVDVVHLWHMWLQFRLAFVSRESLVVGNGKLVWDPRAIASHYVRSFRGFWLDLYVILPIPQIVLWTIVPTLLTENHIMLLMTVLLLIFLFQFLPKVYHSLYLLRKLQKVTGYVFGTIWWGFGLNVIAYFIASHAIGGCWYVLGIQRVADCLIQQCNKTGKCNMPLSCSRDVCYHFLQQPNTMSKCGANSTIITRMSVCLDDGGPFNYGIYSAAVPVISSNAVILKILYPISWGLFQLSSVGNNLTPTSQWAEVLFCIFLVLGGLMLFTLMMGNIQVFLHTVMAKKTKLQMRSQDMEWWMKRRQLPSRLRHRVYHFERHNWFNTGGVDEMELIKDFPDGLRRDIKRYLCLDLMKKVPLFSCLDDIILDNICDRVKPLIYCKDEKILREGDPVQKMVFIVRGRIKSNQNLSKGMVATDILGPGDFLGDELISWCLRRPFIHRLPASSTTLLSLESTEAFGLDAYDLRYITEHFRYKFSNKSFRHTLRYHSSIWRTWASVIIQTTWRRYVKRTRDSTTRLSPLNGDPENRLLQYAAMFMSIKPHDHLD